MSGKKGLGVNLYTLPERKAIPARYRILWYFSERPIDRVAVVFGIEICNQLQHPYLCAIDLHGQRPSTTTTSKVAHVTVNRINRNPFRAKHQCIHLALM